MIDGSDICHKVHSGQDFLNGSNSKMANRLVVYGTFRGDEMLGDETRGHPVLKNRVKYQFSPEIFYS